MRIVFLVALLLGAVGASGQEQVAATVVAKATLVLKKPLKGEPIEGFSSIDLRPDGSYWVMADTGHGARRARKDVQLVFHHIDIDWLRGSARLLSVEALRDPDRKLPFPIVNEASRERLLTMADLNIDAMHVLDYSAWLADDLGPYLVQSDLHGRVRAIYAAEVDGVVLKASLRRRGFGGLAASPDGRFLYAALEGPLWTEAESRWETLAGGREYLRILEFDVKARRWTGRGVRYVLEAPGHTLADLTMLDASSALVVERGPQFRRIYKVLFDGAEATKRSFIDLAQVDMDTVEGITLVDPGYLALSNGGRAEFLLLRAP